VANLLIVEDSQVTAHMVTRSLQSAGHKCRWAATGGQALEEIRDHPADLTILDYVLPDLNGMEVLKGILDLNPAALVVMVTGRGTRPWRPASSGRRQGLRGQNRPLL
jgi:DNA-binding response OmpR family regulator